MRNLLGALSLLTRVPVPRGPGAPPGLAASVPWFPVVGALVGLAVAGAYAALGLVLPALPAAAIAVSLGSLVTGAFHEDGLADTADALGGSWSREEALQIMRDPHLGTFGVLALVWSTVVRVACLATLGPQSGVAALVGAHALSRGAAVGVMGSLAPATADGMAAAHVSAVTRAQVLGGLTAGLVAGAVALGPWLLLAGPAAALGAAGVGWFSRRRIGGVTGDVLGAAQQVAEVLVLIVAAAVAASGASLAWWR